MNEPEFVPEIQLVSMSQLTCDNKRYNAAAGLWFPDENTSSGTGLNPC